MIFIKIDRDNILNKLSTSTINLFVACFVVTTPLLFEFVTDWFLSHVDPVNKTTVKEQKAGQFTLLLSLSVPLVLVFVSEYNDFNTEVTTKCVTSFCHGLAVCTIYGQLRRFNSIIWNLWEVLLSFALYVLSQVLFTFGQVTHKSESTSYICWLALTFSVLNCGIHLWIGKKYFIDLHSEKMRNSTDSDSYFCVALNTILSTYLITRTVLILVVVCADKAIQYSVHVKMVILVILVVVATVVPDRMMRRGLMTIKVIILFYPFHN
jgi:hypothetical protein